MTACLQVTSALAGLQLFVEGGKLERLEKKPWSKVGTNDKLNPQIAPGLNQTQNTFNGGIRGDEHCYHRPIPAPL